MKKEKEFKRKCQELGLKINRACVFFMTEIRYKEYLHNVYYEHGKCYCDNDSERRLSCSDIEICRYKNRIQVTMVTPNIIKDWEKNKINKILKTKVDYKELPNGSTEIIFYKNPQKI